jgi:hypothetical protein
MSLGPRCHSLQFEKLRSRGFRSLRQFPAVFALSSARSAALFQTQTKRTSAALFQTQTKRTSAALFQTQTKRTAGRCSKLERAGAALFQA